jgi:hypothetical protein
MVSLNSVLREVEMSPDKIMQIAKNEIGIDSTTTIFDYSIQSMINTRNLPFNKKQGWLVIFVEESTKAKYSVEIYSDGTAWAANLIDFPCSLIGSPSKREVEMSPDTVIQIAEKKLGKNPLTVILDYSIESMIYFSYLPFSKKQHGWLVDFLEDPELSTPSGYMVEVFLDGSAWVLPSF